MANILGALYIAMLFLGIINAMNVQPVVGQERTVSHSMHSWFSSTYLRLRRRLKPRSSN